MLLQYYTYVHIVCGFLYDCICVYCFVFRILFPMLSGGDQNVSQTGLMKVDGFSDPDDYVDIESGLVPSKAYWRFVLIL